MTIAFPDPNPRKPPEPTVPPIKEPPDEEAITKSPVVEPDPVDPTEI